MSTQSHVQGLIGGVGIERHFQQSAAVAARSTRQARVDRTDDLSQSYTPSLRSTGGLTSTETQPSRQG